MPYIEHNVLLPEGNTHAKDQSKRTDPSFAQCQYPTTLELLFNSSHYATELSKMMSMKLESL